VTAVIGGQEDAVGLVVRRDDHADDVGYVVLAQVLFVDPQDVRRRCGERLRVIVEFEFEPVDASTMIASTASGPISATRPWRTARSCSTQTASLSSSSPTA
jgi:hypothetical protein